MDNQHSSNDLEALEAWKQMQALLDKELPAGNSKKNNNRRYTLLLLILLVGSCGVYKWYNDSNTSVIAEYNTVLNKGENKKVGSRNELIDEPVSNHAGTKFQKPSATTEEENLASTKSKQTQSAQLFPVNKKASLINSDRLYLTRKTSFADGDKTLPNDTKNNQLSDANIDGDITKHALTESLRKNEIDEDGAAANSIKTDVVNLKLPKDSNAQGKLNLNVPAESKIVANKDSSGNKKKSRPHTVKLNSSLHVGLEWSTPLPFNNNTAFIEVNAKKQPLTILIPSVWISRDVSKNSKLSLSVNPYSQYLLNSRATLQSGDYSLSAVSASNISQPAQTVNISQTHVLYKVIGVEAALQYSYKLSERWSVGIAIGNIFTNTALLKERIVKNKNAVLKDSLYGVIKTDKDWLYVKHNFLTGKLNIAYHFKRFQLGASFFKPITPVYNSTQAKQSPVNTQLFLRWMWK